MIRINLLPVRAARKKETLKQNLIVAGMAILASCLILVYLHAEQKRKMRRIEGEIRQKQAEIARLKSVIGEVAELKKRKESLEKRIAVIEKLKNDRSGPVRMLDELSSIIPEKAWLLTLVDSGPKITLSCLALNEEVISDFMDNLEKSEFFSNVILSEIRPNPDGTRAFGLTADRQTPPL